MMDTENFILGFCWIELIWTSISSPNMDFSKVIRPCEYKASTCSRGLYGEEINEVNIVSIFSINGD